MHILCLETGAVKMLHKARREVYGWTSDMGVEMHVADGPCILLQDLSTFEDLVKQTQSRKIDCNDSHGGDAFLFPNAIFVGDLLHQLFGFLEDVVQNLPVWKTLERVLKDVSHFLSDRELRTRFQATCFGHGASAMEKGLFHEWSGGHISWRWQHLEKFVEKLVVVWPVLQRRFKLERLAGDSEDLSKIHAQVLKSVAEAVRDPTVLPICYILLSVFKELGRMAVWCEGCSCHEYLLAQGNGTHWVKLARYRKAAASCVWRGRRGCELAAGHLAGFMARLRRCTIQEAEEAMARADPESRAMYTELGASIKSSLCDAVSAKLQHWCSLPWRLLAIFGHMRGICSLERSVAVAATALEEVDAAIATDGGATLHRFVHRLCTGGPTNALRSQLEPFAKGGAPLDHFPQLFVELRSYSIIPIVSRRVEGVHALVSRYGKKCTRFHPRLANAYLRRANVIKFLHSTSGSWLPTTSGACCGILLGPHSAQNSGYDSAS